MERAILKLALTTGMVLTLGAASGYLIGKKQATNTDAALFTQDRSLRALTSEVVKLRSACSRMPQVSVTGADANSIAQAVEQRLAREPQAPAPNERPSGGSDDIEPAENPERLLEGHEIVAQALREGLWTEAYAERLHALGEQLNNEEYVSLLREVSVNLNHGRLRYDGQGPPF